MTVIQKINSKIVCILFILLILSCTKEERTLNYTKRFEKETYDLINDAIAPLIEKKLKSNSKYNKSTRLILEKPYSFYPHDKEIFINIIPKVYISKMDTLLSIKKWEVDKLKNFKLIDKEVPKELYKLSITDNYEVYQKAYRNIIGESYIRLSNPIFTDDFSKAFIYTRTDSFFGGCLNNLGLYLLSKENGTWIVTKDLLRHNL